VAVPERVWSLLVSERSPEAFGSYQHPVLAGLSAMKLVASKEGARGAKRSPSAGLDAKFEPA
jgi:hypothetical protein